MSIVTGLTRRKVLPRQSSPVGQTQAQEPVVPVAQGGTGASTAAEARAALGIAASSHTHAGTDVTSGTVPTARLGSGSATSSTYLRGDSSWATPAGGIADGDYGDIVVSGSGTVMTVDSAASISAYQVAVGEGGLFVSGPSGSGYIDPSGLSDARNYTLPDRDGTFMLSAIVLPTCDAGAGSASLDDTYTLYVFTDNGEDQLTATLPDASTRIGKMYVIKNKGTLAVLLATTSSQTIDGAAPGSVASWDSLTLASDGANWIII